MRHDSTNVLRSGNRTLRASSHNKHVTFSPLYHISTPHASTMDQHQPPNMRHHKSAPAFLNPRRLPKQIMASDPLWPNNARRCKTPSIHTPSTLVLPLRIPRERSRDDVSLPSCLDLQRPWRCKRKFPPPESHQCIRRRSFQQRIHNRHYNEC